MQSFARPVAAAALAAFAAGWASAAGSTAPRIPSSSTVAAWKASVERFLHDSAPKAERLKAMLPELSRYDLAHPDSVAALTPLRDRLEYHVSSALPAGAAARIGDAPAEVERWAVIAGPLKPILSERTRRRVDAVSKSSALSDRMYWIARQLTNGNFGWEDPAPVVAALPKERQQMYNLLYAAKGASQRVLIKDSRSLSVASGRVDSLLAEEGKIRFTVSGRRLELDDPMIEVHKFVAGDLKKVEAAMTAAQRALLKQLVDARANRTLVTLVVAIVLRQDIRGTIVDLWAEGGQVRLTFSESQPGGPNLVRDFALSEVFGFKP